MGLFYYYLSKPEQSNEQFDKAIKLNPNDWLAYSKKGELYLANDDFFNTISYLQKAASLNRGTELPYIMGNIGYTYFNYGFPEKARQYYEDKLKLDCDTLSYYSALADNEFWQSNFNKSIEYGNKGFSMDSTHVGIIITLGRDYEMLGQAKVSLKYFSKWLDIRRTTGVLTSFPADIGYVFRLNGNKKEADDFNDDMIKSYNKVLQLKREGEQAYYSYYNLAKAYALKGEKDIACENLKIFSQIHQCPLWLEMEMKMDPVFDCIREESDFKNIANDIEAKYQAKHERVKNWLIEHKML
jgi:tetratricopeptide (TPR) repeat protein